MPSSDLPVFERKAEMFKALGHPARVRCLELLVEREHTVSEMQAVVGLESSHLSQQLAVLRRAGLVTTRRDGASVVYAVKDPRLADLLRVARQLIIASLEESRDLLSDLEASGAAR